MTLNGGRSLRADRPRRSHSLDVLRARARDVCLGHLHLAERELARRLSELLETVERTRRLLSLLRLVTVVVVKAAKQLTLTCANRSCRPHRFGRRVGGGERGDRARCGILRESLDGELSAARQLLHDVDDRHAAKDRAIRVDVARETIENGDELVGHEEAESN